MALDNEEVGKIAHLARLHLSDDDNREVTRRISDILALIDRMRDVNTDSVEPLAHPFDAVQPLRPDRVTETNERDRLQTLAPAVQDGLFLVPRVIE